jgi:hypothetical protein
MSTVGVVDLYILPDPEDDEVLEADALLTALDEVLVDL